MKESQNNEPKPNPQKETMPLIRGMRKRKTVSGKALEINRKALFNIWADFDDTEAPKEVIRICESYGLGITDAISFTAFCYGYEKAIQKIKEQHGLLIP
jgi:hypothetical protein